MLASLAMLNETFSVIFKHCVMDLFILQLLLPQLRHPKRRRTASKEAWRRMESHSAVLSFLHFVILQLRRARKKWGLTLSKKAYVCPWFMFHSTQSQPNLSILVKSDLLQQKTNIAWSTKKCHDSSWKKEYQEAQFSSSFWSCQNKRKRSFISYYQPEFVDLPTKSSRGNDVLKMGPEIITVENCTFPVVRWFANSLVKNSPNDNWTKTMNESAYSLAHFIICDSMMSKCYND